MNEQVKSAKATIRAYLSDVPTPRLAEMLAWAQDGKMDFWKGCACLVGSKTASVLHSEYQNCRDQNHLLRFEDPIHRPASYAFSALGHTHLAGNLKERNLARQRRIVPILKAALRLRMRDEERNIVRSEHWTARLVP